MSTNVTSLVNPESIIKSTPKNLHEVLSGNNFIIPDYQRDYVWTTSEVTQLITDLCNHLEANYDSVNSKIVVSPTAYFLGAIVLIPSEGGALEVVDGQQRLTTITCLFSVLDHTISQCEEDDVTVGLRSQIKTTLGSFTGRQWHSKVRFSCDILSGDFKELTLLKHSFEDKSSHWDSIKTRGDVNPNAAGMWRTLTTCSSEIDKYLNNKCGEDQHLRCAYIKALTSVALECLVLLMIDAQSNEIAYDLFESLNNRGVTLSQSDLIKNKLLKEATNREEVIGPWVSTKAILDSFDFKLTDFLHYSYISRNAYCSATKLYESTAKLISPTGETSETHAGNLFKDARIVEKIHDRGSSFNSICNRILEDFTEILNVKFGYVGLISAYRKYGDDNASFEKLARKIVNFCFRFIKVQKGSVSVLAQAMCDVAKKISTSVTIESCLRDVSDELKTKSSDAAFKEAYANVVFKTAKLGYYNVYWLESHMLSGTLPIDHGVTQHLEHIMPKRPGSEWPNAEREKEVDRARFSEKLWSVGNLLALPDAVNSSIGNRAITHKIENGYDDSSLHFPREVRGVLGSDTEWGYGHIEAMQIKYAQIAPLVWEL